VGGVPQWNQSASAWNKRETKWISHCCHSAGDQAYQVGVASLWPLAREEGAETHVLYVWSRPDVSMKWMGCLNHNLTLTLTVSLHNNNSMIHVKNLHPHFQTWPRLLWWQWSKDTVIQLPTTYQVCQTPFICMKWIWYEYAGDGRSQSYPTACPHSEKSTQNPTTYDPAWHRHHVFVDNYV
jgi:hypothetical protein